MYDRSDGLFAVTYDSFMVKNLAWDCSENLLFRAVSYDESLQFIAEIDSEFEVRWKDFASCSNDRLI